MLSTQTTGKLEDGTEVVEEGMVEGVADEEEGVVGEEGVVDLVVEDLRQ